MGKKDPRVDAYIADAQPFAKPILKRLRKIVHQGCPEVEEGMRWSFPSFMHKGLLCGMGRLQGALHVWILEGLAADKRTKPEP